MSERPDPVAEHRAAGAALRARCAVLVVSDTRTLDTDRGGALAVELLTAAGHLALRREVVADEPAAIAARLGDWIADPEIDVVVATGGTGIARRDTTIEVVEHRLDKRLDGFGELFRMLGYAEIGSAAMLSRATAGLAGETFVFALPGSTAAVRLALERLVLPELGHLLSLRR